MVFVTGCNGLIGSFITKKLIDKGHQVKALKRPSSDLSTLDDYADKIEWIEGDILDYPLLEKSLEAVDLVVHAAAMVSFAGVNDAEMEAININGTNYIVNAAIKNKVRKFCFISSIAALGRSKNGETINENTKWQASKYNSTYAESKYLAELEVWRGIEEGLDAFILNPSVVIGPGDWTKSSTKLFNYVWKEPVFYTSGAMNYIDVRDLTEAFFKLLEKDVSAERFILNGGSIPFKIFFEKVAMAFNKKAPPYKVTPFLAAVAWRLAKIGYWLTNKPPLISRDVARMANKSFYYESKKLTSAVDITFSDIDNSISWTCDVLKKRYNLP